MDNLVGVEVAESNKDLGRDELNLSFSKPPLDDEMVEDIATSDVFQEEVDTVVSLEHVIHRKNEWVFRLKQYVFLRLRVQDLSLLNQDILVYPLHRVFFPI